MKNITKVRELLSEKDSLSGKRAIIFDFMCGERDPIETIKGIFASVIHTQGVLGSVFSKDTPPIPDVVSALVYAFPQHVAMLPVCAKEQYALMSSSLTCHALNKHDAALIAALLGVLHTIDHEYVTTYSGNLSELLVEAIGKRYFRLIDVDSAQAPILSSCVKHSFSLSREMNNRGIAMRALLKQVIIAMKGLVGEGRCVFFQPHGNGRLEEALCTEFSMKAFGFYLPENRIRALNPELVW